MNTPTTATKTATLKLSEKLLQHRNLAERLDYAKRVFSEHIEKGMPSVFDCLQDLSLKVYETVTLADGREFSKGAFLSSADRFSFFMFMLSCMDLSKNEKTVQLAKEIRIRQHEEYLSYLDKQNKEAIRHLRFADDVEPVLDVLGNFKEDNRPAFGTSYREQQLAEEGAEPAELYEGI